MSVLTVAGTADFEYLKACVALSRAFVLIKHGPEDQERAMGFAHRLRETVPNGDRLIWQTPKGAAEYNKLMGLLLAVAEVTLYGWSFRIVRSDESIELAAYQEAAAKMDVDVLVIDLCGGCHEQG